MGRESGDARRFGRGGIRLCEVVLLAGERVGEA